jgi:hypothetical protein
MKCINCSENLIKNSKFCSICGHKVDSDEILIKKYKDNLEEASAIYIENDRASKTRRFINYNLDLFFSFIFVTFFILLFDNTDSEELSALGLILSLFAFVSYYVVFEFFFGKTFAKFITRTKVVNLVGEEPSLGQIVIRSLGRLIPLNELSIFFTKNNETFHDLVSGTIVIKEK